MKMKMKMESKPTPKTDFREFLINLSERTNSSQQDGELLEYILRTALGYPYAVCTTGMVYLEGISEGQNIHSAAKFIRMLLAYR